MLRQVISVPILAGLSGRGVQPLTWFSAIAALCGMSLLEGGGSPPSLGDLWSFLSALAFGVQVHANARLGRCCCRCCYCCPCNSP
jgi:drug/metabolite transporter (DMT)-like permease